MTVASAGLSVVSPCKAAQLCLSMHALFMYALTTCSLHILNLLSYVPKAGIRNNASDDFHVLSVQT